LQLKNTDILNIWEQLIPKNNLVNAVIIVHSTLKTGQLEQYYDWSLEKLDAYLYNLRCQIFGNDFLNISSCPSCKESLEWSFEFGQLGLPDYEDTQKSYTFKYELATVEYRLPNTEDLLKSKSGFDGQTCILSVIEGNKRSLSDLSDDLLVNLQKEIEHNSLYTTLSFELSCDACNHKWNEPFEIVPYFIKEIDAYSQKLLNQVHLMSSVYGWEENNIIEMNPKKRNYYLNLISSS